MGREPEQALIAERAEEEAGPLVEVAVEADPACGEGEAPDPEEPATVEVSFIADHLNLAVPLWLERVPQYFAAK